MEVKEVLIKELIPNEKNPRKISKAELNKLIRSIKEFGFVDPIIVNSNENRKNVIIGGHQRVLAATKMKKETVPVTYVNLTEDKENLLNIALNEISGEWDDKKLFDLLKELDAKGVDLTLTGFDEPVIDEIMQANEAREKEASKDITPAVPDKPKSQPGEVYLLGPHRVMCGDSTKEEDFKILMAGKTGDITWTDPPYGVSYKGTNNPNGRDWGVLMNDDLRKDELYQFLFGIYQNVAKNTKPTAALYTCYASVNHFIFEKALNDAGFIIKQQLIWEKGHVLGHSDYHWCHEPILYCRKKDQSTEWLGDRTHKTYIQNSNVEQLEALTKERLVEIISAIRKESDIIHLQKDPSQDYLHSTQKPVELSRQMIKNNTRPKELIIEPCLGSGSTLIACEMSNRVCYGMELDPKYVDVILTRYLNFTKTEPLRESDGKKWSDIKK